MKKCPKEDKKCEKPEGYLGIMQSLHDFTNSKMNCALVRFEYCEVNKMEEWDNQDSDDDDEEDSGY